MRNISKTLAAIRALGMCASHNAATREYRISYAREYALAMGTTCEASACYEGSASEGSSEAAIGTAKAMWAHYEAWLALPVAL